MKKLNLGDVYVVQKNSCIIGLLQYIGDDLTLPGSNIVRVIAPVPSEWQSLDDSLFMNLPKKFTSHVFLKAGETLKIWQKVAKKSYSKIDDVTWCSIPVQDLNKSVSADWLVWKTGENKRRPLDQQELNLSEFGYIMSPDQITNRILTDNYSLPIPVRKI